MVNSNKTYTKLLLIKYKKQISINIIILFLISILSIIGPLVARNIIDNTFETGLSTRMICIYFILLTFLYILKFIYNRFKFKFARKFKIQESTSLFKMIFNVSYDKFNEMEPTYLAERNASTIDTVFNLYSTSISGIVLSGLTMIILLFFVARIDLVLFILYLLQIPLQYFGFKKMLNGEKSKLANLSHQLQTVKAKNNKDIRAVVSNADAIKQYKHTDGLLFFINRSLVDINDMEYKGNSYAMDVCTILEYIAKLLQNSMYIYIVYLYVQFKITVGDMVYLNLINEIYFYSVASTIDIQINLRNLKGATDFVQTEIISNFEKDGSIRVDDIQKIDGAICNVGYDNKILIKSGEFSIKRGDIVGIKGDSGTGKSTFIKIFNKTVSNDTIKINDILINKINNDSLRERIMYLPQQPYLLPFSIRENISLGNKIEDEKWKTLIEKDFMKKFIELDEGLETKILENGSNLSGGDKQKIILARIMLSNPDVIILDESVSSIDESTGLELINDIINLFREKIVIIISHTQACLEACNTVIEIKDNKLTQYRKNASLEL